MPLRVPRAFCFVPFLLAACGSTRPPSTVDDASVRDAAVVVDMRDASPDATVEPSGPCTNAGLRRVVDCEDSTELPQIHFVYALPSDGVDRALDTTGDLQNTIESFAAWFEVASEGRPVRIDRTAAGFVDITFVTLPDTGDTIARFIDESPTGVFVRDYIEQDLLARPDFGPRNKLYAVYYDGPSNRACGGAPGYGVSRAGGVTAMYLQGTPAGAPPCNGNPFVSSPTAQPGYLEYAMIHEIVHALGFTGPTEGDCAVPHRREGDGSHVSDFAYDLMYAGNLPWDTWREDGLVIDVDHDDYFLHNRTECPDLARSAFLENADVPTQLPVGW